MKKTSLPRRALSAVLSATLAFTLIPSAAFAANTDDAASESSDAIETSEQGSSDASVLDADRTEDVPSSDAQTAETSAAASVIHEERTLDTAAKTGVPNATTEQPSMVSAAVQMTPGASAATITASNGLNFQLGSTEDGTPNATLMGISGKIEGVLAIPASVTSNNITYAVTNIGSNLNLGGGVQASA